MQLSNRPEDFPGYFATILWVGIGVFLFWTTPGATFFSWQALVYFLIGTAAAAVLFGLVGMTAQRLLPSLKNDKAGSKGSLAPVIGTLFAAAQLVVIYFLAKAVVSQLLFPPAAS